MPSSGALSGIRVIDFGRFIAGPYCGMLLADMGADVVRIDRRHGSEDRYTGPVTSGGEGGGFSLSIATSAVSPSMPPSPLPPKSSAVSRKALTSSSPTFPSPS